MENRDVVSQDPLARLVEKLPWPTPGEEVAAQDAVRAVLGGNGARGRRLREVLHGSWLHEPLHVIMTDVPVGAWTAAVLFDALGAIGRKPSMDKAADALVVLGLVGAAGAAVTGMNDWSEIRPAAPRRIGAVHALLNIAATGLFAGSWWARRRPGRRPSARALALVGFAVVSVSAHLGGNLIYEHGIGVQRGKRWDEEQPGV